MRVFFRPFGARQSTTHTPRACARGYVLLPLRGWEQYSSRVYRVPSRLKKPVGGKFCQDPVRGLSRAHLPRIQSKIGIVRGLVRVGDAGECWKDSCPCLGVESFHIAHFAHGEGCGDVNEKESSNGLHLSSHILPNCIVRRYRGANRNAAMTGDLRCDESNPADIQIAMLLRKTQLGG